MNLSSNLMANSICSGMTTLAVSLEKVGATNDILASVNEKIDHRKITFTDSEPVVKLDAPTVTEIEDMPIFIYHAGPNSGPGSKWAVDCILNWNGGFKEPAKIILRTLSDQARGNNEWSSQWNGKYDVYLDGYHGRKHKCKTPLILKSKFPRLNSSAAEQLWNRMEGLQTTISALSRPRYRMFLKHYCKWRNWFTSKKYRNDLNPCVSKRRVNKRFKKRLQ